ncbi:DUF3168 domain-containing protein [Janthinobacterium sp. UMAB-56]|uniref:DUF3168 domain-containing protein n=1 Tax=Janthinobacterium sp. UMAB-56 TaxID=1365361 RepID=UPI001C56BD16|nr:DUF3168 domain-containing protein [Janthinobacterium sp. UMAB-56]
MTIEVQVFQALRQLVDGRVYPDLAPADVARPYIVYQQVGGDAVNFLDGAISSKRNSRMQVCAWAEARIEASTLIELAELALHAVTALQAVTLGAPVATYDEETTLRGARQDFSLWI